ncbi:MAG: hypothetical protein WAS54_01605 [Scrofimicrobium sp.]
MNSTTSGGASLPAYDLVVVGDSLMARSLSRRVEMAGGRVLSVTPASSAALIGVRFKDLSVDGRLQFVGASRVETQFGESLPVRAWVDGLGVMNKDVLDPEQIWLDDFNGYASIDSPWTSPNDISRRFFDTLAPGATGQVSRNWANMQASRWLLSGAAVLVHDPGEVLRQCLGAECVAAEIEFEPSDAHVKVRVDGLTFLSRTVVDARPLQEAEQTEKWTRVKYCVSWLSFSASSGVGTMFYLGDVKEAGIAYSVKIDRPGHGYGLLGTVETRTISQSEREKWVVGILGTSTKQVSHLRLLDYEENIPAAGYTGEDVWMQRGILRAPPVRGYEDQLVTATRLGRGIVASLGLRSPLKMLHKLLRKWS